jgi:hypothetical protein
VEGVGGWEWEEERWMWVPRWELGWRRDYKGKLMREKLI